MTNMLESEGYCLVQSRIQVFCSQHFIVRIGVRRKHQRQQFKLGLRNSWLFFNVVCIKIISPAIYGATQVYIKICAGFSWSKYLGMGNRKCIEYIKMFWQ